MAKLLARLKSAFSSAGKGGSNRTRFGMTAESQTKKSNKTSSTSWTTQPVAEWASAPGPSETLLEPGRNGLRNRSAETSALHGKRYKPRDTQRAMSQENLEVVRAAYDAWNAGDMDAF